MKTLNEIKGEIAIIITTEVNISLYKSVEEMVDIMACSILNIVTKKSEVCPDCDGLGEGLIVCTICDSKGFLLDVTLSDGYQRGKDMGKLEGAKEERGRIIEKLEHWHVTGTHLISLETIKAIKEDKQ